MMSKNGDPVIRHNSWAIACLVSFAMALTFGCGGGSSYGGGGTSGSPSLGAAVASQGTFSSGEQGAAYSIIASNTGTAATSGTVTVADPPTGFTVTAMSGANWTCTVSTTTCTYNTPVGAGQSFPAITVTGNVTAASGTSVSVPVSLSGGGAASVNVTPTPTIAVASSSGCSLTSLGSESVLNGTYTVVLNGWHDNPAGPFQAVGVFIANGLGVVTSGEVDLGSVGIGVTSQLAPEFDAIANGCYQIGPDLRGLMMWNFTGGRAPVTFAFSFRPDGFGSLIEFDDANPGSSPGTRAAGEIIQQVNAPFTLTSLAGPWDFGVTGYSANGTSSDYLRSGAIGRLDISASGAVSNGVADVAFTNDGLGTQTNADTQAFNGSFTAPDSFGRGTLAITFANFNGHGPLTLHFAYYFMDSLDLWLQSTDTPDHNGHALENGAMAVQAAGLGVSSLTGNAVFNLSGIDLGAGHNFTVNAVGQMNGDGVGGVTVLMDEVSNGSVIAAGTNTISGGSFTVSPNGMGTLTFGAGGGAKVFSVVMDTLDDGFLLEGTQASPGANVLTGNFRQQVAPPGGTFIDGTFAGSHNIGPFRTGSSTRSAFQVGSAVASTSTTPASLNGTMNITSGAGCSTNCVMSDLPFSATYSFEPDGRVSITFGPGTVNGTSVGWLANKGRSGWFLSDTADPNGTLVGILGTH
jgi:hypothetical protein